MAQYFENDQHIKSEIKKTTFLIRNHEYVFYTDNGVFAKKGLDLGTHLLLESVLNQNISGRVLDLGCGYGPIGIVLKHEFPDACIDMTDVNLRALELARKNVQENKVDVHIFESYGYEKIDEKYQYIISNPPIRVGKKVLYDLLIGAKEYLVANGELWIVIHKDQGAKSTLKELEKYYQVEVVNKSHGFFIIVARNN